MTPFGINFENKSVIIKLRFNKDLFLKTNMNKFGEYKTTETGFVIFSAQLSIDDWHEFEEERLAYKRLAATK